MFRMITIAMIMLFMICTFSGCMEQPEIKSKTELEAGLPDMPEDVEYDADGVPIINVYVTETDKIETMDIETYLMGVLAGEMRNDWPIEALKAQAILARTYTMKFLASKDSRYENADISTDVTEAQAYNAESINDRVRRAVEETRGLVMTYDGELPYAWFHAHSGGMTELATIGLEFKEDPEYLKPVASADSDKAPDDVKSWKVSFDLQEVEEACRASGLNIERCESVELGNAGKSGRVKTLIVNGREISAPTFRINIGAEKLKSTLIEEITVDDSTVTFEGRGFGHGVGMSQWGAFALAEKGATAQTIVSRYFEGVSFVDLWE